MIKVVTVVAFACGCCYIVETAVTDQDISDIKQDVKILQASLINATINIAELKRNVVEKDTELAECLSYLWLIVCGALVMFMQAGFAMLESGTCRSKNAAVVLMKNVVDACVGTIVWFLLGYGLSYGGVSNEFMGTELFALANGDEGNHYRDWFFQWAFCATAATIVSGGVAERVKFGGYVIYSVIMTGIIYPVIVYWTWSGNGFLTVGFSYSDFAGSGIVHLTGGVGALVGAVIVGPRSGRWESPAGTFDPHSMGLVVLGTFILWFGWYGFNCGSTLGFGTLDAAHDAARVATNTTISAASGGLAVFLLRLRNRTLDMAGTCNGILAGLVAVCAGVNVMSPGFALLTGILGGLASEAGSITVRKFGIDDPLDAFAVHGCAGLVGVLTRPLFDKVGADGDMFKDHIVAILCIVSWSGGLSGITFGALRCLNFLVETEENQLIGCDSHMAHSAYNVEAGK